MKALACLAFLAILVCVSWASAVVHDDSVSIDAKIGLSYRGNTSIYAYTHPLMIKRALSRMTVSLVGPSLHKTTIVQQDGAFSFASVPSGPYQLEVYSPEFHFTPLRVEVSRKDQGKVKMKYIDQNNAIPSPFIIRPDSPIKYFQEPQSMLSLYVSMLSSPMLLMMFAVVALMTCMQYIDPEAMTDLQAEVSGQKGKEKMPYHTLPGLIAKPKQGNKLTNQIAGNAPPPTRSKALLSNPAEDSDSQEDEDDAQ